jgi:hypothetical protein
VSDEIRSAQFADVARDKLTFLERDYGYVFTGASESRAKWRSERVDLVVHRDPLSYELDVLFRPRLRSRAGLRRTLGGDGGVPLTLADAAAWRDGSDVLPLLPLIVRGEQDLVDALTRVASWLRERYGGLLRGDAQEFLALDRAARQRARKATSEWIEDDDLHASR